MTREIKRSAGAPNSIRRYLGFLSLRSLKLRVSEEICGRFGYVSTDGLLHIDLLGFRPDDVRSASQFDVASLPCVTKHMKLKKTAPVSVRQETMCRGSSVKDMRVIAFQLESLILAQNERWRHA